MSKNKWFKISRSLFLLSLIFLSGEREGLCGLVQDHITLNFNSLENRYDNGYLEERYDEVLDQFISEFEGDIRKRGGTFHILRDWSDGAVNAWAWRIGQEYWIEAPGGMSRYHLINEEGFILTLCHELGHLLGGSPHRMQISFEGQADYFSAMKCMERILSRLDVPEKNIENIPSGCVGDYCHRRFSGIRSLTSYYAELEKRPVPSLNSPDQRVVEQSLRGHPGSQCRFDTMVAALRCSSRLPFSYDNSSEGACSGLGARPACWFSPRESHEHN